MAFQASNFGFMLLILTAHLTLQRAYVSRRTDTMGSENDYEIADWFVFSIDRSVAGARIAGTDISSTSYTGPGASDC